MVFEISWHIENRVIFVRNEGILTLEDLKKQDAAVQALLERGQAPIHIISDNTQLDIAPQGLSALQQTLKGLKHPNIGWVINIESANQVIRYIAAFFARVMGIKFVQVSTMVEAIAHLQKQDMSIDWDLKREKA